MVGAGGRLSDSDSTAVADTGGGFQGLEPPPSKLNMNIINV